MHDSLTHRPYPPPACPPSADILGSVDALPALDARFDKLMAVNAGRFRTEPDARRAASASGCATLA